MGEFVRDKLPDPLSYFDGEGVPLHGGGRWRTGRCDFHGGSDSLRVNTETGAWRCMACGTKGGDVLAYAMQRHGLEFVDAARRLGAYRENGRSPKAAAASPTLSARSAMELAARELRVALLVIGDAKRGVTPCQTDWQRFVEAASRVEKLAEEYRQ